MKNIIKYYLGVFAAFLLSNVASAQSLLGQWELRGSYLKIGYTVRWEIVSVGGPRIGYKASGEHILVEFFDDGRVRYGNEWGTYSGEGSRLALNVKGLEKGDFNFQLHNNELTLWAADNAVAGLSKPVAKAAAIIIANQMEVYNQFPDLGDANDVYSLKSGIMLDYAGSSPPSGAGDRNGVTAEAVVSGIVGVLSGRRSPAPDRNGDDCAVSDGDHARIASKADELPFEDEKLKFLQSAVNSKKCFTTAQVRELLALLAFDREKLPLARSAYQYVTDRDNFYELEELFYFMDTKAQFRAMLK